MQKIWAIGGGKGGAGKSFIISSLGITLARSGKTVTIVDLDLGGANLHTCLGSDIPQKTLSDYLSGRTGSLNELLTPTSLPNLQFISGANDSLAAANVTNEAMAKILNSLHKLPGEYLLIDLGAGTHTSTLDFFLCAQKPIIVMTPEPTAIENGYRFIKAAYFHWMKTTEQRLNIKTMVNEAMDHKNSLGIKTPHDLLKKIIEMNPDKGNQFKTEVEKFHVNLIMNQIRTKNDIDTGYAIASICKKYFGIQTDYVGYLDYDNSVWQSVRKRRPLILEYPYSALVNSFSQIAKQLEDNERSTGTNLLRTA